MLYTVDSDANTIRALDLATGAVTTLAGKPNVCGGKDGIAGAARFCQPVGIAADADGTHLYVTDSLGETVRTIDLATDAVTTVAGTFKAHGAPPTAPGRRGASPSHSGSRYLAANCS